MMLHQIKPMSHYLSISLYLCSCTTYFIMKDQELWSKLYYYYFAQNVCVRCTLMVQCSTNKIQWADIIGNVFIFIWQIWNFTVMQLFVCLFGHLFGLMQLVFFNQMIYQNVSNQMDICKTIYSQQLITSFPFRPEINMVVFWWDKSGYPTK